MSMPNHGRVRPSGAGSAAPQYARRDCARRASIAAGAAERLASTTLEEMLDTAVGTGACAMRLDRLLTSAAAVSRVSSSIAAGVRIDATTWDTVITTLVRMNNRCREHLAGDQYVRYLLQLDVTERLLAQYVAQDNRPRKKRANQGLGAAQAQGTALIEVALALSVDDPLLATQLLVGVALRALAAISVGMPRRRRGR